jgi:hypothetical protein
MDSGRAEAQHLHRNGLPADATAENGPRQEATAMLAPTQKVAPKPLVHHPWAVLDDLCSFTNATPHWLIFDEQISEQLKSLEDANRKYWTPKAVRQSLGRK